MCKKEVILIVHNHYQIPGGEDTVVINEKQLLEKNGHIVHLYTRNNTELTSMGLLKKAIIPFTTIFNLRTYFEIKKIIIEQKIDIVHVHNTLNLISPAVYYAAKQCNVPVIQTIHNFRLLCPSATFYRDNHICEDCIKFGLSRAVKYNCYKNSKIITLMSVVNMKIHRMTRVFSKIHYICLTEFNRDKLLLLNKPNKKQMITQENVFVKPNFTFEYNMNSKEPREHEYYLFIGRVETIKGMDVLIDAFCRLPDQRLLIAGTGTELEKYKEMVRSKKLSNISFLGFLKREELNNVMIKSKAVIVPSQWYETFGMIIVEAFSNHVPVIVGDIGNISGLIQNEVNGLKFKYDSGEDLANALIKFEKVDMKKYGNAGYQAFLDYYSQEVNYIQLRDIYCKISLHGKVNK